MFLYDKNETSRLINEIKEKVSDDEELTIDDEFMDKIYFVDVNELNRINNLGSEDLHDIVRTIKYYDKNYRESDYLYAYSSTNGMLMMNVDIDPSRLKQFTTECITRKFLNDLDYRYRMIGFLENKGLDLDFDEELIKKLKTIPDVDLKQLCYIADENVEEVTNIIGQLRDYDKGFTKEDYGKLEHFGEPINKIFNMEKVPLEILKKTTSHDLVERLIEENKEKSETTGHRL